jgi:HSP20 family protein
MTTAKPPSGTEVQHWRPFAEVLPWNTRLGQLFENMWQSAAHEGLAPGAELEETDEGFTLEMDLPGVAKDDITIDVVGRRVTVRGTRKERERSGVMRHSTRITGSFAYEVMLPADVDDKATTAKLSDGVLTIKLPKASGAKTNRVPIS